LTLKETCSKDFGGTNRIQMWSVNQLDPLALALDIALTHSQKGGQVELCYFNIKGDMCPFSARQHVNRWVEKMAKDRVIETSQGATGSHARMGLNLTV
jgi:hypothetical protein